MSCCVQILPGEGKNLQFAIRSSTMTFVESDAIELRIGRVHRYGQTQDVFIFNLCTAGTVESRILRLLTT